MNVSLQGKNELMFMRLLVMFICSLFVLSIPYIAMLFLLAGLVLFLFRTSMTMRIDRHVAAFGLLFVYVFGWGLLTGGFHPSSLAVPGFYGGEGRILIAYMPIFLVFAAPQTLFSERNIKKIFRILFYLTIAAALLSGAGLINLLFGSHHAAGYAAGSLLIIFICLHAEEGKKWQRVGIVAALLMLMFANSRTTLVGLAMAFAIYYRARVFRPKILFGAGTVLAIGVYVWSVVSPFSFDRFVILFDPRLWSAISNQLALATATDSPSLETVERVGTYYNILSRIILWGKALWLFQHSPFLGIGSFRFNDYGLVLQQVLPGVAVGTATERSLSVATAHNSYFHTLAEGGILGFGLYFMPWIMMLRTLKQRSKNTPMHRMMAKMGSILILFMMFGALTGHLLAAPSMTLWVLFVSSLALRATAKTDLISERGQVVSLERAVRYEHAMNKPS